MLILMSCQQWLLNNSVRDPGLNFNSWNNQFRTQTFFLQLFPAVITPKPVVLVGTPSSTTTDQDAPSTSISQTNPKTPSPVIPLGVEEVDHGIEVAHIDNNPYVDFLIPEPSSKESPAQ
ncbi:hypothetical protein Tco_0192567, partial [Tanacetum coccineum]